MVKSFVLIGAMALAVALPGLGRAADTVVSGLNYPWDIEAHGEALFITEKGGTLGVVENGKLTRLPVHTSAAIFDDRGGGLMGLALRPDFSETGRAVVYHHIGTADSRMNRVIEIERRGEAWVETRVLLDEIPGHPLYNGGRVAFGPDGMLYVTTGWTENYDLPQHLDSLAGKILRITPSGAVPQDNPFGGSPVYSLGHRNPQGLAWDADGQLYAAEHGQSGNDEVNRILPGGNYGWPLFQGDEISEDMDPPLAHSGRSTWAPSGLAWDGDRLLLASLRGQNILAVTRDGSVSEAHPIGERIRDVLRVGSDLFAITSNRSPRRDGPSDDRLIKITD